jgi:putative transposase
MSVDNTSAQNGARPASVATKGAIQRITQNATEAGRAPTHPLNPGQSRRVYELVRFKRSGEAPPEVPEAADDFLAPFRGWHTRGYLPHCDKPGLLQMISYRLNDAMPASRRREWMGLTKIDDERERMIAFETYLDKGFGRCVLRDPRIANVVEEGWLHGDGKMYRLVAWIIMPNHVHLLVEVWDVPLSKVVHTWKSYSARVANRILGRSGDLWQHDFWDRYIRDEAHFNKAVHYIESNPIKAALVASAEQWSFTSANAKWKWTAGGRYRGAHLIHDNWKHSGARPASVAPKGATQRTTQNATEAGRAPTVL